MNTTKDQDKSRIDSVSQFPQLTQVLNKLYVVAVTFSNMNTQNGTCSSATMFVCIDSYHMNGSKTKCDLDTCIHGAAVFADKRVADDLALAISKQQSILDKRQDGYRFSSIEVLNLERAMRYLHGSVFVNTRWNDKLHSIIKEVEKHMELPDLFIGYNKPPTLDIPHIRPSKLEFSFASAGKNPSAVLDYVTSADGKPEEQDEFRKDHLSEEDQLWVDRHDGVTSTTKLN